MQIILLSGGSGTRLWPLSNDARSKQFLKLLPKDGSSERESMIQRVIRQLRSSDLDARITVATGASQRDSVIAQIGDSVDIVTEPSRRDTFPAICLACEYLAKTRGCEADEIVVVMPCDPYTDDGYFAAIGRMAKAIGNGFADMMVMGIEPTYPSSKFGYIVPVLQSRDDEPVRVQRFTEKPDTVLAKSLIAEGALWNGGVFAFRLGYLTAIADKHACYDSFSDYFANYNRFPKISFDYEVAEKADSIGVVRFDGEWKDLGTWNALTDELTVTRYGDVTTDGTDVNTHIFNELSIPLICLGTQDLVIAASRDGILVAEKSKSESIKDLASGVKTHPMFEERSWGSFSIIDREDFPDGSTSITRRVEIKSGSEFEITDYPNHDKAWTILQGDGEVTINGVWRMIRRGDVVTIPYDHHCSLKAITPLIFIEVSTMSAEQAIL